MLFDGRGRRGHAGLFSSAADLSIFARMLLQGGEYKGARILSPCTIETMTIPQSPGVSNARGLGWDIEAPWVRGRELADYLNLRKIEGVEFLPVEFTPESSLYKGCTCLAARASS